MTASLLPKNLKTYADVTHIIFIKGGKKDLTKAHIKVNVTLHRTERIIDETERIVGVTRCVQKWVRKVAGWRQSNIRRG